MGSKLVSVKMSDEIVAMLDDVARMLGKSRGEVIRNAVVEYLVKFMCIKSMSGCKK